MRPATTPSVKFTYDDFVHFPDDGQRHEIIGGEHHVTPSPDVRHQTVSMNLTRAFILHLEGHHSGRLFAAPLDIVFSTLDVVEPDLLYISRERLGILAGKHVRGAPDLVVEILSPGTRTMDEGGKREIYGRFGVREYWLVDPRVDSVTVFRQVAGALDRVAELSAATGAVLTTPVLPGLSIPLSEIFAS